MDQGEVGGRYREELHAAVAGLLAFLVAVTIWGLATPVFFAWGETTDAGTFVWIDANESPIDILAVLIAAPLVTLAWTLLAERRIPWPIGRRHPRLAFRRVLLVGPVIGGLLLAFTLASLPPGEVRVAEGVWVTFGRVPAVQAALAVMLAAGIGLVVIISVPATAPVVRRLDPARPVMWLSCPVTSPHPGPAEPEPAA